MKKNSLLLMAFLLICRLLSAQVVIEDSINISREQWRDSIFRIDKSLVPTGILWEYSLAPFDSTKYNGVGSVDTIKDFTQIFQLGS